MIKAGVSKDEAQERLQKADGFVRSAIENIEQKPHNSSGAAQ